MGSTCAAANVSWPQQPCLLPLSVPQLPAPAPPASATVAAAKKVRTPQQLFRDTLHSACSLALALAALAGFGIASPGAAFRWGGKTRAMGQGGWEDS